MRALPVARPVAVIVLLAAVAVTPVVGAVLATPAAASAGTPGAVGSNAIGSDAFGPDASSQQPIDATTTDPDNFTVSIETPGTIVVNASANYSVRSTNASGNTTATWTFENGTKEGKRVTHAFSEDGNATIEVTVTDEDGATVTETLQVQVVEFGDPDDNRGTTRNLATFGLWVGMFFVLVFGFMLVLVPKGMQVLTDAL